MTFLFIYSIDNLQVWRVLCEESICPDYIHIRDPWTVAIECLLEKRVELVINYADTIVSCLNFVSTG